MPRICIHFAHKKSVSTASGLAKHPVLPKTKIMQSQYHHQRRWLKLGMGFAYESSVPPIKLTRIGPEEM